MRPALALVALIIALVAAAGAGGVPVARAEGIEVRSQAAQNRFPSGVNFTIFLASNAEIKEARLRFRVLPDGPLTTSTGQCTAGTVANCSATAGSGRGGHLAPGAEIVYFWEVTDAANQTLKTSEQTFTYQDDRYRWDSAKDGNLTVYFYFGDQQFVNSVLNTSRQTLDRFQQLEGVRVDFPVKVWVYQTSREMSAAAASERDPTGSRVTLGELVAPDTVLVSRDTEFLKIVRHELAHIVTRQSEKGKVGSIPDWVNEGTSVFAQNGFVLSQEEELLRAIQSNKVLPVTSLNSTINSTSFLLAYAQSGAIIGYLVNTHGDAKFAEFIAALGRDTIDGALKSVYGFDQAGLEDAWRKSVNLPAAATGGGGSGSTSANERPIPTLVPFGAQGSGSGASAATPVPGDAAPSTTAAPEEDGGSSALPIVIAVVVLLAVAAGGGFWYIRRSRAGTGA